MRRWDAEEKCIDCVFFTDDGGRSKDTIIKTGKACKCRRYPEYTIRRPDEWCGEWKRDDYPPASSYR